MPKLTKSDRDFYISIGLIWFCVIVWVSCWVVGVVTKG